MFERTIYDAYGIYCEGRFSLKGYDGFYTGNQSYLLFPKEECLISEKEMLDFTNYVRSLGDFSVLEPLMTKYNKRIALVEGQEVYVSPLPNERSSSVVRIQSEKERGAHLAQLHHYGKRLSYSKNNEFFGQWPKLWEARLEQLEGWYQQILYSGPQSEVDEAFLYTYPYFMGLTENAIQYAVDATLDDPSRDQETPTIAHRHFSERTWMTISEDGTIVKRPTEWLYDHPCRDIAEWLRDQRLRNETFPWEKANEFLSGYEHVDLLSSYSRRLLYARLLFPLHYFEAVELFYSAQVKEERMQRGQQLMQMLMNEGSNEQFLKDFAVYFLQSRSEAALTIPTLEWLG
ncbi:spore coat putative kinase YutH [Halalkalibacter hemicellulosilyticus]|uniref:Spore coat protein S n=1 Tax=Halalkalibacter hemicellulosilyticusJCM 9152 TaxID=1236971 RepID=W4QG32_9BACI|nr:spore coat protein YutH [Halalkalibacter hemicellulosilyticus]GAE30304.1 spore coat protein S [Halalkalibacter hemicellulosilyticusJCM 9152]